MPVIQKVTDPSKIVTDELVLKELIRQGIDKMTLDGTLGCPFLKKNRCTIYKFRPDACWTFPFHGKSMMIGNEKVKQMQIRIRCQPALDVARKLIAEVMSSGDKILLPDLTIIPVYKE